jgi:ribosomal protein S18 acetylase RimI-like enzyme
MATAAAMTAPVSFRAITPADEPFLYRVYASTRADEMALVDWDEAQKEAFLRMQFHAQHNYYQEHYARARYDVVLRDEQPIGRLYVDRTEAEINIIDIALLPEHRGAGIGTAILRDLLDEADRVRKPVVIYVERFNPALRLYRRLGFQETGDSGVYFVMKRPPAPPA